MKKKLFKHGGSYAVDLPMSFVRDLPAMSVSVERDKDKLVIAPGDKLDGLEAEPEFKDFVGALLHDALKRPKKLREIRDVWDKEWDRLLKDVSEDEA